MGYFSYNCKECGHPLLSRSATDKGINDWMSQGVILTIRGSVIIGEYDGYGRCGEAEDIDSAACLHEACWEKAGKPGFKHYGSPSDYARDQGFFFNDGDHDLIDPRIETGREELLAKGIKAREERRFEARAWEVYRSVGDPEAYRTRFGYMQDYEAGKPIPNKYVLTDRWHVLFTGDDAMFSGSEGDVKGTLTTLWDEYMKTDEAKALVAHAKKKADEAKAREIEKLKVEGRYEVKTRRGVPVVFVVRDNFDVSDAAVFKGPGAESDEEREIRRRLAEDKAKELNAKWAADGFPLGGFLEG